LFVSPSVVEDEKPIRRAQQRSCMPGREAAIPPSPPRLLHCVGARPRFQSKCSNLLSQVRSAALHLRTCTMF